MLRVPAMVSDPESEDAYLAEVRLKLSAGVDPNEVMLIRCASRALRDALVERVLASREDRDDPGMDGDLAGAGRGIGKTWCRAGARSWRGRQCRRKVCTCRGGSVRAWRS